MSDKIMPILAEITGGKVIRLINMVWIMQIDQSLIMVKILLYGKNSGNE